MSKVALKLLMVEDSSFDAELLLLALSKGGYEVDSKRVDNAKGLTESLQEPWDIVVSDYVLPSFGGLAALKLVRESGVDVPVIIVSGQIGEEVAVQALKAGADDYLLKDRLARLPQSIDRALQEAAHRRERRKIENALRESEERYRKIVETSPEGTFILWDGRFSYVNPAGLRLYGANSPLELIGRSILELADPASRSDVVSNFKRAIAGQEAPFFEHTILRLDGTSCQVESAYRTITHMGQPAIQVISRDMTERNKAQELILQAERMGALTKLAGRLSGDFKNLLTMVLGYTGVVRAGLASDTPLVRDLDQISANAERALSLTRQLSALSGTQQLSPSSTDLNEVLERLEPFLGRLAGGQISVRYEFAEQLPYVEVDQRQLEQVIMQFVGRARDVMPKGGSLTIRTECKARLAPGSDEVPDKQGHEVLISFIDKGPEIPENVRSHIFEPFADPATSESGIGLAAAYGIVKQHGGSIECAKADEGGTVFTVAFPVDSGRFHKQEPSSDIDPKAATILIVEDEEILLDLARHILRKHGFNVLTASNGEEAMKIVHSATHPVDLLFTDVVMPRMTGPELASKLTSLNPSLPVIYTSGYTREVMEEFGLSAQRGDFLEKPYNLEQLVVKVKEVLSRGGIAEKNGSK
jgi:two-component system cell cycle sensor histidine kinase/response regulator CckA